MKISIAAEGRWLAEVDGLVVEDDTYFVLGSSPGYAAPREHPIRTLTAAWEARPARPGSVIAVASRPVRLRAVVHDLSLEPSWRIEWVREALGGVLAHAERLGLDRLAMPVLGAEHGRFPVTDFMRLLGEALAARRRASAPSHLLLRTPAGWEERLRELLEQDGPGEETVE